MTRPLLALAALLAAPAARAAAPLAWDPAVDVPVTLATGAVWAGLYLGSGREPVLAGVEVEPPSGIDALAVTERRAGPAWASDVLLYGTLAGSAAASALAGARHGGVGAHLGVLVQAFAIDGAVTEVVKHAVDRPRPYVVGGEPVDGADDLRSFFSGHSSTTAAVAVAAARSIDLGADLPPAARVALYGGAAALAGTTAALRVAAGRHWPSDVLVGLAVGGSIGWLVPELHRADRAAVASVAAGARTVSVGGRF